MRPFVFGGGAEQIYYEKLADAFTIVWLSRESMFIKPFLKKLTDYM